MGVISVCATESVPQNVFHGRESHCWILRDALRLRCLALGDSGCNVPERDDI